MAYIVHSKTKEKIPISKILCVGANYREHIIEMSAGKTPNFPTEPVIFMKPPSAVIHDGGTIIRPDISSDMHHEVELIIVIGTGGKAISKELAMSHVLGYAVGLDMTLRDLQAEAKNTGRPWTIAKGFDTSALISEIVPKEQVPEPGNLALSLYVNTSRRQHGSTSDMIFSVADIVTYVSRFFTLERGDLIYTGTPSGVGPAISGDRLRAVLENLAEVSATVA